MREPPVNTDPTGAPPPAVVPWNRRSRLLAITAAAVLAGLLATAACLTPDPAGHGTHTQLGLTECLVMRIWHVPCPSCGMTTAWAHLMKGNLAAAAGANAGGLLLAIMAMIATPWLLASGLAGRWWYLRPRPSLVLPASIVVAIVICIDWCRRAQLLPTVLQMIAGS